MKIAYDAKRLFNNTTGLGNYSRSLLEGLSERYPENEYLLFTPKIKKGVAEKFQQPPYRVLHARWIPPRLWRSFWMSKYIEEEKCELFHGLSNEIPLGLHKVRSVVTIHDLIFKALPQTYPKVDRILYDKKSSYACRQAHRVVAISESTRQDIQAHYGVPDDRLRVVYQSCHPEYYSPLPQRDGFLKNWHLPSEYLLSVGALQMRKNTLGTLRALALLPESQRLPLVVVGQGRRYKAQMQDFIQKKGLGKWVIFLNGNISRDDLRQLYAHAQALVYPSLYEGFGLPIVESLLCGTPVVTSDASSLPEAAGPGGLLVPPGDAEALAEALRRISGDRALGERLAEAGRDYAWRRFHPDVSCRAMMEVYRELLSS